MYVLVISQSLRSFEMTIFVDSRVCVQSLIRQLLGRKIEVLIY